MGQRITGERKEPASENAARKGLSEKVTSWQGVKDERCQLYSSQKAFRKREMHDRGLRWEELGVWASEPNPKLSGAWWRCSRRDSQGGDHVEPVGQGQEFGFYPATMEGFQKLLSRRVTWSIKQLQKSQPSRASTGGKLWNTKNFLTKICYTGDSRHARPKNPLLESPAFTFLKRSKRDGCSLERPELDYVLRDCSCGSNYNAGVIPRPCVLTVFLSIDSDQRWALRSYPKKYTTELSQVYTMDLARRTKYKPSMNRKTGDFNLKRFLTNPSLLCPMIHLHQNHLKDLLKCRFLISCNPQLLNQKLALSLEDPF